MSEERVALLIGESDSPCPSRIHMIINQEEWYRKHRRRFPELYPNPESPHRELRRRVRSLRGDNLKYQKLLKSVREYFQERPGPNRDLLENDIIEKLFK